MGIAFPASGGVLVSGVWDGTLNLFPTDTDNQSFSDAGVTHQRNFNNPLGFYFAPSGLTESGGKVYLANQQSTAGSLQQGVYQLNDNGTVNHLVTALAGATGITTNPTNGHLFVSTSLNFNSQHIIDVNPSTGATVDWTATHGGAGIGPDGLTFSPDGKILYASINGINVTHAQQSVQGYDFNTGNLVFSTVIPGADGTALGSGVLAGKIYINSQDGNLFETSLTTGVQTLIATGGSRGDFDKVDPTNNTLLLTQTDSVLRLTAPPGGGFVSNAVPEPTSLVMAGTAVLAALGYAAKFRHKAKATA